MTDGEKDPRLMGFHFEDDGDATPPVQGSSRVDDESAESMMALKMSCRVLKFL